MFIILSSCWLHFVFSFTQYFVVYKLGEEYTGQKELPYAADFMPYLAFASQIPNVIFNWFNIFIQIGYGMTNQLYFLCQWASFWRRQRNRFITFSAKKEL